MSILEIGPSSDPSEYQKAVNKSLQWDTLELTTSGKPATYLSEKLYQYPISEGSYDVIVAGQVMEHVADLWSWLAELKRIIKRNGFIVLISPTSWPYHEAPIDCWRIFPEGMKILASKTGLTILEMKLECLELEALRDLRHLNTIEGRSCFHNTGLRGLRKINFFNGFVKRIPLVQHLQIPTEVAFDLITILKK